MIDLHSHILPGMDDGSANAKETAGLLRLLSQQGVTTVAATPHFYPHLQTLEDFLSCREAALARMPVIDRAPQLLLGAEVAFFSGIGSCEDIVPLQIGNTGFLLIEMPFSPWSARMADEICEISYQLKLTPVLAHIDRYRNKNQLSQYVKLLRESGVYFQCNADAFLSRWSRRWALKMLQQGYVDFLGSDCHNLDIRKPRLDEAAQIIEKKLGAEFLQNFHENAHRLLFQK